MNIFAHFFYPEYANLYKRYQELREHLDEREEEMTDDMDKLEQENDYLKSELALLRVQYDRAKEQLDKKANDMYDGLVTEYEARAKNAAERHKKAIDYLEAENSALAAELARRGGDPAEAEMPPTPSDADFGG